MVARSARPSTNGHSPPRSRSRRFNRMVNNAYQQLVNRWGPPTGNFSGMPPWLANGRGGGGTNLDAGLNRDLNAECGYLQNPQFREYRALYDRSGPAHRAVNLWPDECWGASPDLYETSKKPVTAFETAWADLSPRVNPWHYLHRVDRLSGIGSYGVLFLGFDGGPDLTTPVVTYNNDLTARKNTAVRKLIYMRAFDQDHARIVTTETNLASPRYGLPTLYQLGGTGSADDSPPAGASAPGGMSSPGEGQLVHWSRCIHVADNREGSEVFGVPRLRPVLDHVMDVRKILGAAAEMFWKGGFPGYAFETYPDVSGEAALDEDDIKMEVAAYIAGLQRYLTAVGGKWTSLAPQVADPSKHLAALFDVICSTLGIPKRIFLGTEAGQLASTQDAGTWKERLHGRQVNYLEPMLVRPFVNRLMDCGALPRADKYIIEWRDLRSLGEKDRADVFLKLMQAMNMYSTGQVSTYVPLRYALSQMGGFTDEAINAVIAAVGENPQPPEPPQPAPAPGVRGGAGGASNGRKPAPRVQGGGRRGSDRGGRIPRAA